MGYTKHYVICLLVAEGNDRMLSVHTPRDLTGHVSGNKVGKVW